MKRWTLAPVFALGLTLLGCGRAETPAPDGNGASGVPRAGGMLQRRLEVDVATLNPILPTSRYDRMVAQYLFTPLVQLDADLRPIPALATAWDVNEGGLLYRFHLDPKATYSDGRPVRASDVLFTLRKIVDPASEAVQVAGGFEHLDLTRTKVIDDHTIDVAFREILASQLTHFYNVLVTPEHVYGALDFKTAFDARVIGSGPYLFERRIPGKEVVLRRRKDFWGEQKPYIDTILFKVVTNDATAWNAARLGELDETTVPSDVWNREKDHPAHKRKLEFLRYYGLAYNYIGWNSRNPLFSDKRIRRALGMCLDTRSIIVNLYGGTARAMNGHFVPEQWAYNPDVAALEFNPSAAKQTFTSLGWLDTNGDGVLDKDGQPFRFELTIVSGSAQGLAIAQLFQQALQQVGVQADVVTLDGTAAIQRILAGNYDAAYLSWDLDPDPDPFPLYHSSQFPPRGQNFVYYSNPQADSLIEQGRREIDMSKRQTIYRQLHAILADDQPYTWVMQPSVKWVVNRRVSGVKQSKGWGLFLWYPGELDWWVNPPTPVRAATAP